VDHNKPPLLIDEGDDNLYFENPTTDNKTVPSSTSSDDDEEEEEDSQFTFYFAFNFISCYAFHLTPYKIGLTFLSPSLSLF